MGSHPTRRVEAQCGRLLEGVPVVGGLGGCHDPSNHGRHTRDPQGYAKRHYTREDIDRLIGAGHVDVLLTRDAPSGFVFPRHRRGLNWASEAAGLDDLVRAVKPQVCFFGHHHRRVDGVIDGVQCVGLNIVGRPGNLVALRLDAAGWAPLGEWPEAAPAGQPWRRSVIPLAEPVTGSVVLHAQWLSGGGQTSGR